MKPLSEDLAAWADAARRSVETIAPRPWLEEIGTVQRIGDGVAKVSGLYGARADELLRFDGDAAAMVITLDPDSVGVVMLSPWEDISAGSTVRRTREVLRVPVGDALLGRVVDPLGRPLDDQPPPAAAAFEPIERPAPAIIDRDLVSVPLQTGITVIDAMVPLGRGQRELIIGDRQTGKTSIAVDTMISQKASDVVCVYVAVGQKSSSVNRVIDAVRRHGAPERCIFVIGHAESASGLRWIAPYAGCTIAEYFRDRGGDALLIIDDLTKHATVYRELSLLLRRPPGREAYPGDIFYVHARLLERAARLSARLGGGSLTALPIAETQAGNISAYIPTNLISITDGQIMLNSKLFYEGQRPAVDVGKSVSRVGGRTQAPAIKRLASSLRLNYAQFLELEMFTRFGAMMDDPTRQAVEHGRRIRAILRQPEYDPLPRWQQVALLLALEDKVLDALGPHQVDRLRVRLPAWLLDRCPDAIATIERRGDLTDEGRACLAGAIAALAGELGAG